MPLFPSSAWLAVACSLVGLASLVSYSCSQPDQDRPAKGQEPLQALETSGQETAWQVPPEVIAPKCSASSVKLAQQLLAQQLQHMDQYNSIWFNDLDAEEIRESQKQSLANIILMSSLARQKQDLLLADTRLNLPLIEIESSGFRPLSSASFASGLRLQPLIEAINSAGSGSRSQQQQQISAKLLQSAPGGWSARHNCRLVDGAFLYTFRLVLGPLEHNLDVVYNLPKELRISQPIDWRYAQIKLIVPVMVYEITLKQSIDYKLSSGRCPLELADVTYLSSSLSANSNGQLGAPKQAQVAILAAGMAATNQTISQLERLFDDYTRPSISRRLRQVLKFHLNSKTLPLWV